MTGRRRVMEINKSDGNLEIRWSERFMVKVEFDWLYSCLTMHQWFWVGTLAAFRVV